MAPFEARSFYAAGTGRSNPASKAPLVVLRADRREILPPNLFIGSFCCWHWLLVCDAILCALGSFCLALIGPPRQCVWRAANATVRYQIAHSRRASLAAIDCSMLAPNRDRIKRSLSASVRHTEAASTRLGASVDVTDARKPIVGG